MDHWAGAWHLSVIAGAPFESRQDESGDSTESSVPKTDEQYHLERLSWFGLVGVLVISGMAPEWLPLHHGLTPLAGGLVLLIAAFLELRRRFQVCVAFGGGHRAAAARRVQFLQPPGA